jgi:hypothetical protein
VVLAACRLKSFLLFETRIIHDVLLLDFGINLKIFVA